MKPIITILFLSIISLGLILAFPRKAVSYEGEAFVLPDNPSYKEYAFYAVSEKWGMGQAQYFFKIIEHESGWCHTRWNGQYGECPKIARTSKLDGHSNAQGLCQTMLSAHGLLDDYDFMNDGYRQIDWCIDYTEERYGTPERAWDYWKRHRVW